MGSSFDVVGTYRFSASGRSITLELDDRLDKVFVGCKKLQRVLDGKKKSGTIYVLNEDSARKGDVLG